MQSFRFTKRVLPLSNCRRSLKFELKDCHLLLSLVITCIFTLVGLVVYIVPADFLLYRILLKPRGCLPLPILLFVYLLPILLSGMVVGILITGRKGRRRRKIYAGCCTLLGSILCLYLWPFLFFGVVSFFFSLVVQILAFALTLLTLVRTRKESPLSALILLFCLWFQSYLLWLNTVIAILN